MATPFSSVKIDNNKNFVSDVIADQFFKKNDYLYGNDADIYWAAVDLEKHPLYVWEKNPNLPKPGYVETAHSLGAVVFSNGPLMLDNPARPYGPVASAKNKINDPGGKNLDQWLYGFGRKPPTGAVKYSDYVFFLLRSRASTPLQPDMRKRSLACTR